MEFTDFYILICKMRHAQKMYFKTRLQADLIAAKMLEAEVDKVLKELSQQRVNGLVTTCNTP